MCPGADAQMFRAYVLPGQVLQFGNEDCRVNYYPVANEAELTGV